MRAFGVVEVGAVIVLQHNVRWWHNAIDKIAQCLAYYEIYAQ